MGRVSGEGNYGWYERIFLCVVQHAKMLCCEILIWIASDFERIKAKVQNMLNIHGWGKCACDDCIVSYLTPEEKFLIYKSPY